MSRQTRRRRGRRHPLIEPLPATEAGPLTLIERDRLHQRYAHLSGRSIVLGFASLGIVVKAATPEELIEATDAPIVEATWGSGAVLIEEFRNTAP